MSVSSLGWISVGSGGGPPTVTYGAGSPGAGLPVPPGAVSVTPANITSLINSNPSGTDFDLGGGSYTDNPYPNKTGNGYYGDENDHTSSVFDGQVVYDTTDDGGVPTSGDEIMMVGADDNVFANFTVQKFIGNGAVKGGSPWSLGGTDNILFRNVEMVDNWRSGLQLGGTNHEIRRCTSKYNGRYCFNGSGDDHDFYNCDGFSSGDQNMRDRGLTPHAGDNNVGISKFVFSDGIRHHECWYHDIVGYSNGLWWDIDNSNGLAEDCLIETIGRFGLKYELGHSGTVRRCVFNDAGTVTQSESFRPAAIASINGGVMTFEDNVITGTKIGISLRQNDRDTGNPTPGNWSGSCGTIVRRNTIDQVTDSWMVISGNYTKNGCNINTPTTSLTIEDNDTLGSGQYIRAGSSLNEAQWNALGYD